MRPQTFNEIIDIRMFLKGVQQLSWDINATDKRYPIESVEEDQLEALLGVYKSLRDRLINLAIGANAGEPF